MVFSCCFNKFVPESDDNFIVVKPLAWTFVTGLATCYNAEYDIESNDKGISRSEFNKIMG